MKPKFLFMHFVLLFLATGLTAQQEVSFWYDGAGNRTSRNNYILPVKSLPMDTLYENSLAEKFKSQAIQQLSFNETMVTVYPNPTEGIVHIKTTIVPDEGEVSIVNSTGVLIGQVKLEALQSAIDLRRQPGGMYILYVTVSGTTEIRKLIKR
nr:T9SS type A sorting domain-containing protein [Bacteroidota bacterium]